MNGDFAMKKFKYLLLIGLLCTACFKEKLPEIHSIPVDEVTLEKKGKYQYF